MIHSFNLNSEEEKRFQQIVEKQKDKSESAIIRERIFGRRERHQVKIQVVDLTFLSTLSNLISAMEDNHARGNSITEELQELKKLINTNIQRV